jgi:VIT1/CCC1 family predicted Fe2+/Mn2+ transporter
MFPFLDDLGFVRCNGNMSAAAPESLGRAAGDPPAGQPAPLVPAISDAAIAQLEERHHVHRKVSGGWLRAAVFGAMDGLVTNTSLIAGVGGGGASHHFLVIGGLAGLIAGAFSMAAGEWTSVHAQNGMVARELASERRELLRRPDAEKAELAEMLERHGLTRETARAAAHEIAADTDLALRFHAREELGIDPEELPSARVAAGSSFLAFSFGALIPLLPILFGSTALWLVLVCAGVAAVVGGAVVSQLTNDRPVRGALTQLLMVAAATGATYGLGHLIGSAIH